MEPLGFVLFFLLLVGLGYCTYYVGRPKPGSEDQLFDPTTPVVKDDDWVTLYQSPPLKPIEETRVTVPMWFYSFKNGQWEDLPVGDPDKVLAAKNQLTEDLKMIARSWEKTCKDEQKATKKRKTAKKKNSAKKEDKVFINGNEAGVLKDLKVSKSKKPKKAK